MLHSTASGYMELPESPIGYFNPRFCSFEGLYNPDVRVQFYGMFRRCSSIDNVCTQLSHQLISTMNQVGLHSYNGRPFFDHSLTSFAYINKAAPIAIFYGTPDFPPPFFFDHETKIGGFVCETDEVPQRWVRTCNRFDLILVPSRFCKQAFERSGVTTPIGITPHGLEPEYRPLPGRTRRDPYVFFNTVNSHVPARKGLEELLRCFVRAFPDRSDVQLRIRLKRSDIVDEILADYDLCPQIWVEEIDDSSTADFAAIYSNVHCTVHPSKGEGFGLIPFQSIACETPVIAPQSTGMADFLREDNAMLLRTKGFTNEANVYYKCGSYAVIDEDHLVELMQYAESNWEAECEKVKRIAPAFREKYKWNKVLHKTVTLIKDLAALNDPAERTKLIRQRVHDLTPVD